mmetsp:Transcript_3948/g.7619  ORF Transcript_3948/g.7619 Transcript_3948/m.7619 type:complete len:86 (-) Transcript_3948:655-912(-)
MEEFRHQEFGDSFLLNGGAGRRTISPGISLQSHIASEDTSGRCILFVPTMCKCFRDGRLNVRASCVTGDDGIESSQSKGFDPRKL